MNKRILLVGEPMGLFIAQEEGTFEDVNSFYSAIAGAEFNVAVGLKRLGQEVTYLTKLGEDPFGLRIIKMMQKNGIETNEIIMSKDKSTGFMFKSKVSKGDPAIFYFRKSSAASTLSPQDVKNLNYQNFNLVHMTGITPALTESTREMTKVLFQLARANKLTISFDPNLRPQLWKTPQLMCETINKLAYSSDIFMPGIKEANILIQETEPEKIAQHYISNGTKCIIVKLGAEGAYYQDEISSGYVAGYSVEKIVDTVGAGDGFAAGVLSGLQEGLSLEQAVKRGNAVGAIQVMSIGDNDGLPTKKELELYMNGINNWRN